MELPDCPPGAEGYEDSVIEVAKKPASDDAAGTKAEQEFLEHLNSLKIKVEHGEARPMVERRGRDVSGKWIYLCYPCAAVCSGESILQTHISGKKHKIKLSMKNVWPQSIFDEHPYVMSEKGTSKEKSGATEKVLQKMAEEVNYHNNPSDLENKYNKYKNVRCHIQDSLDACHTPLIGVEYLVEHPPEEAHYEPSYICTLCYKQGHPRTIINHMTCFWHRFNYISRHFLKASVLLAPYKNLQKYREGVGIIMNRIAQRIEDKYGRLAPVNIDKEEYEKEKERIHQWLSKSPHFTEKEGCTMEEIVDTDLIESLNKSTEVKQDVPKSKYDKRDPSPPKVAAPTKPLFNSYTRSAGRQERRAGSPLSDISDEMEQRRDLRPYNRNTNLHQSRYEPYRDKRHESPTRMRYTKKNGRQTTEEKQKAPNYDYKVKLAEEKRQSAVEAAKKTLAYHEKNPEKHPLYPEEWKKFWNRRYKEIQAEGKDPSKHDFKPEWILFWTARMKELHEEELKVHVSEIYRKMCLTPPELKRDDEPKPGPQDSKNANPMERRRSPEPRRWSPDPRRRSPDPRRRSPDPRRRSPDPRRRSPDPRRRSPDPRRRSPDPRHPDLRFPRQRSPDPRRRSPDPRRHSPPDHRKLPIPRRPLNDRYRIDRRENRSPPRPRSNERVIVPPSRSHTSRPRSRSPIPRPRESRGSGSPLSRRAAVEPLRNRSRSPQQRAANAAGPVAPSMQTVLISDDELKPDDLSPWNSDNDMDSILSMPDVRSPTRLSRAGSEMSRASRPRREYSRIAQPDDLGPAENVIATLRLLVALEDYLGSVGPKMVELLTEALRMEKEKGNSSEELLDRDTAVVLMETAKEKLKGAVQAGLVPSSAAGAVRSAVVRTAATLHAADTRARERAKQKADNPKAEEKALPVAGVGEVDRAQIAQQMAAALIAQGKTDVSSEELAQLVDAVVGMAEAKKRESEVKKVEVKKPAQVKAAPQANSSASALQLLQSAYDENEKKADKEEIADAMDGLSDSDLETLLKNFNELSAEEQHSLIAYLKKLEAKEPERVERLRQYVSSADNAAPPVTIDVEKPVVVAVDPKPVTVESDDDDYTVEEVFQSATQKVKEDQIRQEMEIVKKSLEETKPMTVPTETKPTPSIDLTRNLSSATDLLALVQASIQSTAKAANTTTAQSAEVVTSNTQPRSFGDLPEAPLEPSKPLINPAPMVQPPSFNQGLLQTPQNQGNQNNQYDNNNMGGWNQISPQSVSGNRDSYTQDGAPQNYDNRGAMMQDNMGNFAPQNRGPMVQNVRGPLLQDNKGPPLQDNRGPYQQNVRAPFQQDNRGPIQQDNRGQFQQDGRGQFQQDSRGQFQQDSRGQFQQGNRGPMQQNSGGPFQQGNRGPFQQDNRPFQRDNSSFQQENSGQQQGNSGTYMQDNNRGMQTNRQFPMQNNRGPNNVQENRGPLIQNPPNQPVMQSNQQPFGQGMQDNRGGQYMGSQRGSFDNNTGQDSYNQGPRPNFANIRPQNNNNFDNRQPNQQFGNYDPQKNFRGRGGGRGQRGRGRGFYK
ncbi:hypothetical protein evm_012536 [Chilo suppressalis]|nr:hypothetical protein evm_012536 [Chilo suppressalis]